LSPSTTYSYVVRAVNTSGSASSTPASATTPAAPVTVPAAPTGLTATAQSGPKVTLNWNPSAGATYYRVTRNGTQLAMPTAPPYVDTTVARSTRYTYGVAACNSAGCSAAVTVKVRTTRQ
jgi:cellulose 1,4-beta-cellobiosidase